MEPWADLFGSTAAGDVPRIEIRRVVFLKEICVSRLCDFGGLSQAERQSDIPEALYVQTLYLARPLVESTPGLQPAVYIQYCSHALSPEGLKCRTDIVAGSRGQGDYIGKLVA